MNCKICGRECPPGAKICRDCAAARKRAFAVTVTEPLLAAAGAPSVGEPKFAPKPRPRARPCVAPPAESEAVAPEAVPALPLHVVPRKVGVHWLFIGLVAATAIIVLVVKIFAAGGRATDDTAATASTAPPLPVVVTPAPLPPAPTVNVQDNALQAKALSDAPPAKSRPLHRKAPPRVDATSAVVAAPPPAPEPAPVARAVAPPRPVDAPRIDPWEAMNEGLARCARVAFFDRATCEQRLRQQYCGNYWGVVPQCPIGPATDYGQ
ncbi:MAG TPA: hypothetical protein VF814_07165 [Casimicrobiaceae bacterium]